MGVFFKINDISVKPDFQRRLRRQTPLDGSGGEMAGVLFSPHFTQAELLCIFPGPHSSRLISGSNFIP